MKKKKKVFGALFHRNSFWKSVILFHLLLVFLNLLADDFERGEEITQEQDQKRQSQH